MSKKLLVKGLRLAFLGGAAFFGTRWYNTERNHKTLETASYTMNSYDIGFFGRVRRTRFDDNVTHVEVYPKFHYRVSGYGLYVDSNGDDIADEIIRTYPEWGENYKKKGNKKEELTRKKDYNSHKQQFDEGDKKLRELTEKYSKKK